MAKKAAIYTLGCKVNQTESEAMAMLFTDAGYQVVDFQEKADVYVINTCTVTHLGDRKSRQMIRRAKKTNPLAVVSVTGCYAQTSPGEVLAIPGVDLVVGTRDRDKLISLIEQAQATIGPLNAVQDIMEAREFEELPQPRHDSKTRAFIKIQEGCNNFCSYCIIPYARGPLRSRQPARVIEEVKGLLAQGFKEVVLTGIHTGSYGKDLAEATNLNKLMQELTDLPGLERLRLSSIEPNDVSEELLETFAQSSIICNHFHIPLQSGSDTILKKMNRKYLTEDFRQLINNIRAKIPGVGITTDIIIGFPGETEELFEESLNLVRELAFSRLHVFKYSPRKGTPAATFSNQVSPQAKEARSNRLISLGEQLAEKFAQQFMGEIMTVLVEEGAELNQDGHQGYTDNYLRVEFEDHQVQQGDLIKVKLTGTKGEKVFGEKFKN